MSGDRLEARIAELTRRLDQSTRLIKAYSAEARSASAVKQRFVANMSHELRTPIHGILSFARFGKTRALEASRDELLDFFVTIERSGTELLDLVDGLLDLAELDSGKAPLELRAADLGDLVCAVVAETRFLAVEKGIDLELHPLPDDLVTRFDALQIRRVLRRLLANAIQYSPPGADPIELRVEREADLIQVTVRDHGIGIPPEELDSIFDRFAQSSLTRDESGGTGLGLAISRDVVLRHGGWLWAENAERGSLFAFTLPLDQPTTAADAGPARTSAADQGDAPQAAQRDAHHRPE